MHKSSSTSVTAENTSVTNQAPRVYTIEEKITFLQSENSFRFKIKSTAEATLVNVTDQY